MPLARPVDLVDQPEEGTAQAVEPPEVHNKLDDKGIGTVLEEERNIALGAEERNIVLGAEVSSIPLALVVVGRSLLEVGMGSMVVGPREAGFGLSFRVGHKEKDYVQQLRAMEGKEDKRSVIGFGLLRKYGRDETDCNTPEALLEVANPIHKILMSRFKII